MRILNAVSCGDNFTDAATIQNVIKSSGGYFAVSGNDVFVSLQYHPSGSQGSPVWTRETHAPVGNGVLAPGTTGVQFRNYVAGQVGVISAALSESAEPPVTLIAGGAATPSSVTTLTGITGRVDDTGAILSGTGFSVAHVGTGQYTVTFTTPFASIPTVVVSVLAKTGGVGCQLSFSLPPSTTQFQMLTYALTAGFPLTDEPWTFLAVTTI